MTQYLLAAEADKIQDLIFRSVKLKEVVGASRLLSRFGDGDNAETALQLLLKKTTPTPRIVTAGGGSFRLLFDSEDDAREFGAQLAELYRLTTGGSMSVADPVAMDADYKTANEQADANLRQAKQTGSHGQSTAHLPYIAFCASCGTALAHQHKDQYICRDCLNKKYERESKQDDFFLTPFYQKVISPENDLQDYHTPDQPTDDKDEDPTELLGRLDPRRYVAYLVADGNGMGKVFGQCNQDQATKLSKAMTDILRESLAEPIRILMDEQDDYLNARLPEQNFIPALPLILGGDDLFALLPAPWALDIARHFCQTYETKMAEFINRELPNAPKPTMGAAVVICKTSYPHYLAHQVGEFRLKEAKKLAKHLKLNTNQATSVINFEIISGSQVPQSAGKPKSGAVRGTLRPYWLAPPPDEWGLSLETLLNQRAELKALPRRRRSQLRYFFDDLRGVVTVDATKQEPELQRIKKRVARNEKQEQSLNNALKMLGDAEGWLRQVDYGNGRWSAHGLPDLLDAWDFSHKLGDPMREETDE
jgi:hypothetical protein